MGSIFAFFALFCGYSFPGLRGGSAAPVQTAPSPRPHQSKTGKSAVS
jgi:hypothetical protein